MLYCRGLRPLAEEEAKHSSAVSRDDDGEWRYRTAGARLSEDIEFLINLCQTGSRRSNQTFPRGREALINL